MTKTNRTFKGSHVSTPAGKGVQFEQHVCIDDNLLPDAAELEKLKALDPDMINWIKSRTEVEQNARIAFNNERAKIIKRSTLLTLRTDIFIITCAFLIMLVGMCFSAYLIYSKLVIHGSIFGGVTILLMANAFLKFGKKDNSKK